jgi:hypothetical protein
MRSSFFEYSGSLDVSTTRALRHRYHAAFVIVRITSGQAGRPASLSTRDSAFLIATSSNFRVDLI